MATLLGGNFVHALSGVVEGSMLVERLEPDTGLLRPRRAWHTRSFHFTILQVEAGTERLPITHSRGDILLLNFLTSTNRSRRFVSQFTVTRQIFSFQPIAWVKNKKIFIPLTNLCGVRRWPFLLSWHYWPKSHKLQSSTIFIHNLFFYTCIGDH